MLWLIAPVAYVVGAAVTCRLLAGHFAWRMFHVGKDQGSWGTRGLSSPSGEQWTGAWLGSTILCLLWPLILVAVIVPWRIGAERDADLAAREQKVKAMEKELGL